MDYKLDARPFDKLAARMRSAVKPCLFNVLHVLHGAGTTRNVAGVRAHEPLVLKPCTPAKRRGRNSAPKGSSGSSSI